MHTRSALPSVVRSKLCLTEWNFRRPPRGITCGSCWVIHSFNSKRTGTDSSCLNLVFSSQFSRSSRICFSSAYSNCIRSSTYVAFWWSYLRASTNFRRAWAMRSRPKGYLDGYQRAFNRRRTRRPAIYRRNLPASV